MLLLSGGACASTSNPANSRAVFFVFNPIRILPSLGFIAWTPRLSTRFIIILEESATSSRSVPSPFAWWDQTVDLKVASRSFYIYVKPSNLQATSAASLDDSVQMTNIVVHCLLCIFYIWGPLSVFVAMSFRPPTSGRFASHPWHRHTHTERFIMIPAYAYGRHHHHHKRHDMINATS